MFIFQACAGPEGSQVTSGNLKTILHGRTYPPVTTADLAAAREGKFSAYWVILPPSQTGLDEATVAHMYEAVKRSITALGRPVIVQPERGAAAEELIRIFTGAGFKSEVCVLPGIKKLPNGKLVVNRELV